MKAGFTGTQRGMTSKQMAVFSALFVSNNVTEFHHGDCIGADAQAHSIARLHRANIIIHPPTNDAKRAFCDTMTVRIAREYLERNKNIVQESDILFAAPGEYFEVPRSGTWATIRNAIQCNKKVFVLFPNGKMDFIDNMAKTRKKNDSKPKTFKIA